MPSETMPRREAVERASRRIGRLAAGLARLARSDAGPERFFAEFLRRVLPALGAAGGAVWGLETFPSLAGQEKSAPQTAARGPLTLFHQVNFQASGLARLAEEDRARHLRLLGRAMAAGPMAVPPHSGGENGHGANPTDFLLLLAPLAADSGPAGLVEVFLRSGAPPEIERGRLRFLARMCHLAGDFLRSHGLRQLAGERDLWARLEEFTRLVHDGLDPRQTAYTVANEGRRLIECDRVSVAIGSGRRCAVAAASGQDLFDPRANTIRLLGKLAAAATATGEAIWYAGSTDQMAPQVETVVQEYADETHAKCIGVLPLRRRSPPDEQDPDGRGAGEPPLGALIVERIDDSRFPPSMRERAEAVCRHGGAALANALEHRGLFLMPLWSALGKARWVVKARALPRTIAVAAAAAAIAGWLLLWPADLDIACQGTLEPVGRRRVFAAADGRVDEVRVEHGQPVRGPDPRTGRPGTLLAVLRNRELEEEIARVAGERSTVKEQIAAIQRSLLDERLTAVAQNRLSGQGAELRQKLQNLDAQWALLQEKEQDLAVHSPVDGIVVTWDVRNLLIQRPVQRGQRLMEIAATSGPWQVELRMPEGAMGHVVSAQRRLRQEVRAQLVDRLRRESPGPDAGAVEAEADRIMAGPSRDRLREILGDDVDDRLPVAFVLATDPAAKHRGRVQVVQASAEVHGDDGNTVLIEVEIDGRALPDRLMPGAGVSAKVYCGRCSAGYDLLRDLVAWLQRLRFRWF